MDSENRKLDTGAGVNLVRTLPLSRLDIYKLKSNTRNWKIAEIDFVLLDSELSFNNDIISTFKDNGIKIWTWFDRFPDVAQLRFLKGVGVNNIVTPPGEFNDIQAVSSRIHRSNLSHIVRLNYLQEENNYSVGSIYKLKDAGVDGILNFSNDPTLMQSALNVNLAVFSGLPQNYKDVAFLKGHGGVSHFAALYPKLAVDSLKGDNLAHAEVSSRLGKNSQQIIQEVVLKLSK